ncbi:MAG: hypothetical protein AB7O96_14335, partial [Pseudobdellovibrionaceae bacterium]
KILSYFNLGIEGGGDPVPNKVYEIDGKLVAVDAETKHVHGHMIEDCRKVAIRQAILDTTSAGHSFEGFSRKNSHRISKLAKVSGYEDDRVGAIAGVRAKSSDGKEANMSYFYNLNDDSSGDCAWHSMESQKPGLDDRPTVEQMFRQKYWPQFSESEKASTRNWMKNRFGVENDDQVTAKLVGKLIEWECEQFSINNAAQLAQAYFRAQFGTQPIVLLDFPSSNVSSNISDDDRSPGKPKPLETLKGYWVFRMADPGGTKFATTKVSFDLTEKKDKCEGQMATSAEVFAR